MYRLLKMEFQQNKTIFQQIINREIPSNIYYEDDEYIAIYDIDQSIKDHLLVIPKQLFVNLKDMPIDNVGKFFVKATEIALKLIKEKNYEDFKIEINNGTKADQEVMHAHIHIKPF